MYRMVKKRRTGIVPLWKARRRGSNWRVEKRRDEGLCHRREGKYAASQISAHPDVSSDPATSPSKKTTTLAPKPIPNPR